MNIDCPCGKTFYAKPSHVHRRKYCSRVCCTEYRVLPSRKGIPKNFKGIHPRWAQLKELTGDKHPNWKGDAAGYRAIHTWINRTRGRDGQCSKCHTESKTAWANISGDYKRDLNDWAELCYSCHKNIDKLTPGIINRRFSNG